MSILALTILIVFCVVGFIALFFTTFGTFIILLGAFIYTIITKFYYLSPKVMAILVILYLLGELFEYVFIIIGAKKMGASNAAIFGAIVGGIIGAMLGAPVLGVGIILGTFLGIFLGAFVVELIIQRDLVRSLKAGTGGVLGRVGSIVVKVIIALIMFYIMASRII